MLSFLARVQIMQTCRPSCRVIAARAVRRYLQRVTAALQPRS